MTDTLPIAAWLTPDSLCQLLRDGAEVALLDVRENGLFAAGHLLYAVNAPLDRMGLSIDRLVPRRDTRIVLVDGDGSLLESAANKLGRLGYGNIQALQGGTQAWQSAGFESFIDNHVPSKVLGELVETQAHTPSIDVAQLRQYQAHGRKLAIVDGRATDEFANFSLPGAYNVPNGELPYRIRSIVPDPETLVVVNCAGRTRSIIGTQTLIHSGLPNPVVALRDGTMAWLLAGESLVHGGATELPEPDHAEVEAARPGAQALARRIGLQWLSEKELATFEECNERTLYRFDTRTPQEYRTGHLPGWRWAPGGQLIQATDTYVGVRGARIVLADWDGVRALHTAAWLRQMGGYDVYLYAPPEGAALELGEERVVVLPDRQHPTAPWLSPRQVANLLQHRDARLFDVENSLLYRRKHIRDASFAAPPQLAGILSRLPQGVPVVLTSRDGTLAHHVAGVLLKQGREVYALRGGNQAWFDAGLPVGSGGEGILSGEEDANYRNGYSYTDATVRNEKFRAYLAWEVGLLDQVGRPGAEHTIDVIEQAEQRP